MTTGTSDRSLLSLLSPTDGDSALIKVLVDQLEFGVAIVESATTRVRHVNRVAAEILASTPGALIGQPCAQICGHTCDHCAESDGPRYREFAFRDASGADRFLEAARSCTIAEGQKYCIVSFRDVTASRRARVELARQLSFVPNLIDAIPHPVYYKDREGVYQGCNRAFAESVAGLSPADVCGKTVFDIAPAENARVYHAQDLALMRDNSTQVYEATVQTCDGRPRRFVFYKATIRDDRGETAGLVGSMLDVTELRCLSDRLHRPNLTMAGFGTDPLANIQTLLEFCGETLGSDVVVFNRIDQDSLVTVAGWNLPADYVDTIAASVIAKPEHDAMLVRDLKQNFASDPHVARYSYQTYLAQPVRKGDEAIGAIAALYLGDREPDQDDRTFLGIVAAAVASEETRRQDLADVQRSNAELAELNRRLQENQRQLVQSEKLATLGQLAAGVAHEINNPVGFVMSNLGTLRDYAESFRKIFAAYVRLEAAVEDGGDAKAAAAEVADLRRAEDLDYLLDDVQNLTRESLDGTERVREIVQNLKNFARRDDDTTRAVDINACLESTLKVVWNELKYRCEVVKDLAAVPTVLGCAGELNQVFTNLLVNAAHAIPDHGTITISTSYEDPWLSVAIADTGCGIPPEIREKIFEPFFTTKASGKGTGLGLSISQAIIDKHGGTIAVASEVGVGTTFTVRLPVNHE